ncbi:MAG: response regulator [Sulfurimonas sp.]|nr:response regulator [Sulfurimonas sp.]
MKSELRLLYVEDNEVVRENFSIIFSHYFKNILTTDNGRDALKLYEENDIDIAILDISIPNINGLTVAHTIREKDKKIEIVMLTGHSEKEKLLKAINLHLFAYLVKPVKKDELTDVLERLIQKLSLTHTVTLASEYSFDMKEKILRYKKESIKISKNEKKLLSFLCKNVSQHHTATELSNVIYNSSDNSDDGSNNIIQLISRFKKKMLNSYNKEAFFYRKHLWSWL